MQIAAPSASGLHSLGLARQQERLQYSSLQYELQLADSSGRSVRLSIAAEQLQYSGTYDRLGLVAGTGPGRGATDDLRAFVAGQLAEQHPQGLALAAEHRSVALQASSLDVSIEGDASLLREHLAADNTAQRIMDFARGLGRGIDTGSDAYTGFLDGIERGIAEGFEAVEAMLGPLPAVSQDTRSLLEEMLAALRADPAAEPPRASALLAARLADDDQPTRSA